MSRIMRNKFIFGHAKADHFLLLSYNSMAL